MENYNLGITLSSRAEVQNRAREVGGICGTITAIQIFNHFNINLTDAEIRSGILDSIEGTNQVNMATFMSKHLEVTYCVNYNIKKQIQLGKKSTTIRPEIMPEFQKLLNGDIIFGITPPLKNIVRLLNRKNVLAQFVFLENGDDMTHYGLLCKVENNLMEFTQRVRERGYPDISEIEFMSWWDHKGRGNQDPEQLVLLYRQKPKSWFIRKLRYFIADIKLLAY